jgi:hypothetical protein
VKRHPLIGLVLAGLVGALATGAVLAVILLVNADDGFSRTTVAEGMGWLVPILAGVVTGVVAWALLATRRREDSKPTDLGPHCTCSLCGGSVRGDWRLCPHCGARLADTGGATLRC